MPPQGLRCSHQSAPQGRWALPQEGAHPPTGRTPGGSGHRNWRALTRASRQGCVHWSRRALPLRSNNHHYNNRGCGCPGDPDDATLRAQSAEGNCPKWGAGVGTPAGRLQTPGSPTPHYFVCFDRGPPHRAPPRPDRLRGDPGPRAESPPWEPGRAPQPGWVLGQGRWGGGRSRSLRGAAEGGGALLHRQVALPRRPGVKGRVLNPLSDAAAKALALASRTRGPSHPTPPEPRGAPGTPARARRGTAPAPA
ncbi:hypothetical protein GH733_000939 [Mirounga leonina]|nr:hypothetical protein GH733_000939 [Mirounga leonina]